METSTIQKEWLLEDLSSLPAGNYTVERSDKEDCIYKSLKIPENLFLQISSWRYNFNFSTKIRGNISQHTSGQKTITVSLKNFRGKPSSYVEDHQKHIRIGDLDIGFSHQLSKNVLVKRGNSFFVSIFGADFAISDFSKRYNEYYLKEYGPVGYAMWVFFDMNLQPLEREELNELFSFLFLLKSVELKVSEKAEGVSKTLARISKFFEEEKDFLGKMTFCLLTEKTKKTLDSVKFSVVFNKLFENVDTQEQFHTKVVQLSEILLKEKYFYLESFLRNVIDTLPEARELKKAALKRKSTGAINKIMDDLDFVKIDKELYPLTHEAVYSGDIPQGTFFRKSGDSYFIYNDNWELWEEMLKNHRETTLQIAASCSGRTTYEKDLMSYFYFVLHELPEYLEQQTEKKWKCIPKLVDSANELDPPKEGENGVAKTRSALTPIVDNAKCEVIVPYVSMRIGGYQTTYCYGLTYSVLKRGFSFNGNTVTKDVEKALNGRDDYGLMFYTLTGSAQGRGYPTFLIIFEKLLKSTRVHFHRVHPTRSKGGDYNPIHNWTTTCYKWMIGNVNFERIKAQQGDLAFVQVDSLPEGEFKEVNSYDSHKFLTPVKFLPYTRKDNQNVLGYVLLEEDTFLEHDEHLTRNIPAGTYEIRQCRSWEANPKGIWSLRID